MAGAGAALAIHELREADVGDAGGVVPDDVDVGVQDGGVDGLTVFGQHWRRGERRQGRGEWRQERGGRRGDDGIGERRQGRGERR